MSKYKVGDKVLIKIVIDEIRNNDYAPIWVTLERDDKSDGMWLTAKQIDKYASKTYEDGLNDAWELVRKLGSYESEKRVEIFQDSDAFYFGWLLENTTPQEASSIVEAYEKLKQIQVGDVVRHKAHASTSSDDYIVLDTETGTSLRTDLLGVRHISFDGDWVKTGRHIDIEHLLEQVRGNE